MPPSLIDIDPSQPLAEAMKKLQFSPSPLILLFGDFSANCNDQIASIFQRTVVPVALEVGAIIVDDAKCSGCAAAIARAALDRDEAPRLLGIVRADYKDIEPNHGQVIRLPGTWTDAPKYTFQIVDELVKDPTVNKRVVALLFGGTDDDKRSVVRCARRDWAIFVVAKTGGLADQIIAANANQTNGASVTTLTDPNLREIIETAELYPISADASMDDLRRQILAQIDSSTASETLKEAYERFRELDLAALRKEKLFRRIELVLIILAVIASLLAILSSLFYHPALHVAVVVVPILISIVGAYNSHFREGNKWILFRGSAESLKREIYRFRVKAGVYSDEQCQQASRESKLAAKLKDILSALEQSEANKTNLRPVSKGDATWNNFLSPDDYINERLRDQISYFVSKTRKLSRKLILMQLCIYIVGGAGTFLAAIKLDIWVALATAVVTAFATKLQADQTENSLIQYNQALASLRNIECWWKALSRWEKSRRKNIDVLVDQTEKVLETETAGWVQQMQSALDKLTEKEPATQSQQNAGGGN